MRGQKERRGHPSVVEPYKTKRIHSARWRVFNPRTGWEFAECTSCGYEQARPYPTWCPGCKRLMVDREIVPDD